KVDSQVCDKNGCFQFRWPLAVVVDVQKEPVVPLTADLKKRLEEKTPTYASVREPARPVGQKPDGPPAPKAEGPAVADSAKYLPPDYRAMMLERMAPRIKVPRNFATGGSADEGLLAFILAGVFWGGVSLVTPCVFPMIPITVSFFLKQSEKA